MSKHSEALKLFHAFHGRLPRLGEVRSLTFDQPIVALEVGPITRLDYEAKSEPGVAYFHRFKPKDRPVLFVSYDGSQAYILAGGYRFTSRGLVG